MKWKISSKAAPGNYRPFNNAIAASFAPQSMYAGIPVEVLPFFRTAYYPTERQTRTSIKRCREWVDSFHTMVAEKLDLPRAAFIHAFVTDNKYALMQQWFKVLKAKEPSLEVPDSDAFMRLTIEHTAFACTVNRPVLNDETIKAEQEAHKRRRQQMMAESTARKAAQATKVTKMPAKRKRTAATGSNLQQLSRTPEEVSA